MISRTVYRLPFPQSLTSFLYAPAISLPSIFTRRYQQFGTNIATLFSHCRRIEHLRLIKSLLIVSGRFSDVFLVCKLIKHCFHLSAPQLGLDIFKRVAKPSLLLQNLMLRSLCGDGLFEDVLDVYEKCQLLGCKSDNYTFPFVIKACSVLGDLNGGKEIHCCVLRTGFGDNLVVQTALVDLYAKNGQLGIARLVFDKIRQPDLISWNALISGFCLYGLYQEVFEVLQKIQVLGLKPNGSTLASIIPLCTRFGKLNFGKSLHGFAVKSGYSVDDHLIPALISMYSGCGDLSAARYIFNCLSKRNVTIWNAIISTYTRNQVPEEAFGLFKKMVLDGVQPNLVTFVSIIPSCESYDSIFHGDSLHACVIKRGFESQLSVITTLLSMYTKHEDLSSAKFLFEEMPQKNLLSWNTMISGFVYNRLWDLSLAQFRELQLSGFKPDAISIVSILSSCSELHATLFGKSAHAFCIKRGIDSRPDLSNALISFYSNCQIISYSFKLFHRMTLRNSFSWNSLISSCVHNGEFQKAVIILHQMQQEHIDLDLVTLISVLPCYNEAINLLQGMAIHCYAVKSGFESDVSLRNALISMYINCGELDSGKLIFQNMPCKSVVSWNALFTGYKNHNLQKESLTMFKQMLEENQNPNYVTLLSILPFCCNKECKSIHAYAAKREIIHESPFITSLILMYARFENINSCFVLFQMGVKTEISLWNAMISAFIQSKEAKKSVFLFLELLRMRIKPDYVTMLSLTSACACLNSLDLANSIMAYSTHTGFHTDISVSNALIDMYAKCGDILQARTLFDGLIRKDEMSWSVMINAYALYGNAEATLNLFLQMKPLGLKPEDITYVSILSACSHAGLVDEARMIFNSMLESGIIPRVEHYACMVDLLGRTGYLNEAYEIVRSLSYKPANLLESLLGSCLSYNSIELGDEIGKLILELNPKTSGPYVMLYNLYAANQRWNDANRVRSYMEQRQITKLPGFSFVH